MRMVLWRGVKTYFEHVAKVECSGVEIYKNGILVTQFCPSDIEADVFQARRTEFLIPY